MPNSLDQHFTKSRTRFITEREWIKPVTHFEEQMDKEIIRTAMRNRMAEGQGPSLALMGNSLRSSPMAERLPILQEFRRFNTATTEVLGHYGTARNTKFTDRPGIFRFHSMLIIRRKLMRHLAAIANNDQPNIRRIRNDLDLIRNALEAMGGMPIQFGIRELLEQLKRCVDSETAAEAYDIQSIESLKDPPIQPLSDDLVENLFFDRIRSAEQAELFVRRAVLLDIVRHSDTLLRDPTTTLAHALELEWKRADDYLIDAFFDNEISDHLPVDLRMAVDGGLVDSINPFDGSLKSYTLLWEMERALGRLGATAEDEVNALVDRLYATVSLLNTYAWMLRSGLPINSIKGRTARSLMNTPALEEAIVLAEAIDAISPDVVGAISRNELTKWFKNTPMSEGDRGYIVWRTTSLFGSTEVDRFSRDMRRRGLTPFGPRLNDDAQTAPLSDLLYTREHRRRFRQLISIVRDLNTPAAEAAEAIDQIGFMGGIAAVGLLQNIVSSSGTRGITTYWSTVTPAATRALRRLGASVPQPITSHSIPRYRPGR